MYNFWAVTVLRFVALFFVVAVSTAIYFYPGGNIHDAGQLGYSITHNFLSDLGGYQSHSGAVNFLSAFFFNLSTTCSLTSFFNDSSASDLGADGFFIEGSFCFS